MSLLSACTVSRQHFLGLPGMFFFLTYPAPAGEDYREAMLVITYG